MSKLTTLAGWVRTGDLSSFGSWLSREAFAPGVFRYADVYLLLGEQLRPPRRPVEGFRLRWAGAQDEERLQAIHPSRAPYAARLEHGARCLLGEVDGEPVSYSWYLFDEVHESDANAFQFTLGPGACWNMAIYVHPDRRGSGVFGVHRHDAWEVLRDEGFGRIFCSIRVGNERSVQAHRTVGFIVFCRVRVLRILGHIRYRVDWDLDGRQRTERGVGRWQGHHESLKSPA